MVEWEGRRGSSVQDKIYSRNIHAEVSNYLAGEPRFIAGEKGNILRLAGDRIIGAGAGKGLANVGIEGAVKVWMELSDEGAVKVWMELSDEGAVNVEMELAGKELVNVELELVDEGLSNVVEGVRSIAITLR